MLSRLNIEDLATPLFGWRYLLVHGDACVLDRWHWLRHHLWSGPARTLDAGCGNGWASLFAASVGNDVTGISYDDASIRRAAARARRLSLSSVRFLVADLRDVDSWAPALGQFDQIICCETLEHIKDDRRVLCGLASSLRTGGQLLLTVPSVPAWCLPGDRVSRDEDGGHVRSGYTISEIGNLFATCGLAVHEISGLSGCISYAICGAERLLAALHPRVALAATLPLRLLRPLDELVTRWCNAPWRSFAVVARR